MFTRLFESLAATEELSRVFADASVLQAMLDFEAALARAEARCGVIPATAATKITESAQACGFDKDELTRLSLRAGTPAIPLVRMLKLPPIRKAARCTSSWVSLFRDCTAPHASSAEGRASVGSMTARRIRATVGSFDIVAISSSTAASTASYVVKIHAGSPK